MKKETNNPTEFLDTINLLGDLGLVSLGGEQGDMRNYTSYSLRKLKLIKKNLCSCPKCGNGGLKYDSLKAENDRTEIFRCNKCNHEDTLFSFMDSERRINYTTKLKTLIAEHITVCTICGSDQIQLVEWVGDIELKCRSCKAKGYREENYMSTPFKKELKDLTRLQFNRLVKSGWLHDFYPDAPDNFDEILSEKQGSISDKGQNKA